MPRRHRSAVVLCALMVVAGGVVAQSASAASAPAPDKSGTVFFAGSATTGYNFDPQKSNTIGSDSGGLSLVYDRLLELAPDGVTVKPQLATSWKWDAGETTLTMKLRTDVKFWDGTALDAAAVVANLKRQQEPGSQGAAQLTGVTAITAVDASTVSIMLSGPDPAIVPVFSTATGSVVNPTAFSDPTKLKTTPAGSGPYKLTGSDASLKYTFERWNDYWDKDYLKTAPAKFVNQIGVADQNAKLNGIKTGAYNQVGITAETYPAASSDPNLNVVKASGFAPYGFLMNNKLAPFDNPKVRQAVVMAFDRNAINAALNGLCAPINQAFPPGFDGYIASQKPKQNLAAAKKLIKEAGADGATIKAVAGTGASPYDTLNQIVQSQLQAIGLKVELVPTTPSLLRAAWRTGQYQALSNIALVPTIPDSSSVVANYALGVENPGTKDPALVELNNAAKVQPLGSKARDTAYRKITTYLNDNPIWAPLCSTYFLQVGTKEIQGIPDMPFRHQTNGPDLRSIWISKKK